MNHLKALGVVSILLASIPMFLLGVVLHRLANYLKAFSYLLMSNPMVAKRTLLDNSIES